MAKKKYTRMLKGSPRAMTPHSNPVPPTNPCRSVA